jgi:protein-S-isoprenylcysteine O-methyltransferase Ste14
MIGFYVQGYFCFRVYVISKRLWVAVPIALLFLIAFLAVVVAVSMIIPITRWDSNAFVQDIFY